MSTDERKLLDDLVNAYINMATKGKAPLKEQVARELAMREAIRKTSEEIAKEKKP